MGKINWSINDKNFESFGIKVAASRGFGDDLKQKERQSYNWPGRNGKQYNLNSVPKYEERVIELDCYIVGDNWDVMVNKFNSFSSEFAKVGTQRFIVEIFSYKPRVYDILLSDKTVLSEVKQEGQSFGAFTIKFIEPEPIKKVLYTESTNLQLSFNAPSMVIINIDGKAQQAKGDVSINTNLPNRIIQKSPGSNLWRNGNFINFFNIKNEESNISPKVTSLDGDYQMAPNGSKMILFDSTMPVGDRYSMIDQKIILEPNTKYTLGFDYSFGTNNSDITSSSFMFINSQVIKLDYPLNSPNRWKRYFKTFTTPNELSTFYLRFGYSFSRGNFWKTITNIKIIKGDVQNEWTPAPEDQHFITIAGNIDEITNLNTNAQILWEKL